MMVLDFQYCKDFIGEDRGSSVIIIACDIGVHCVDELWRKKFKQ
jgi:hypothetical protein